MSRLAAGGLIDRSQPLRFEFDGRPLQGFAGDTLASALLANDVRLIGRSFKYHRPRGIQTAGSEEPHALITLGNGARAEPNARATTVELFDGLQATSQNRWPTLSFDLLAINQLFAPILVAGFYYKTFMWPTSFWERIYEPLIRRAAGLGAISGLSDPDSYDRDHGFCDLLVIGGGPAGLAAAITAARAGARVLLADEDSRMGGRLLAETHAVGGQNGYEWANDVIDELTNLPNVRLLPRTTVFGVYDGEYGAVERVSDHLPMLADGRPRQRYWRIVAKRAVLASGAIERSIVFGGNDRPGVMMAGAISAYANRFAAVPGRRAAIFTTNDTGWKTAEDLLAHGIEIAAVIDSRSEKPARALDLAKHGIETLTGAVVTDVIGRNVRGVVVREASGCQRRIDCDFVGMAGGWSPAIGLAGHLGARPAWSHALNSFIADKTPAGMIVAGAANGHFALPDALADGFRAGAWVASQLGLGDQILDIPRTSEDCCRAQPIWYVERSRSKAFVDFQNDVTDEDVRLAAREGFVSIEHLKRYTTLGMGTDQGKASQLNGHAILAAETGRTIAEAGIILSRPPYSPVAVGALAGSHRDEHFRPVRLPASYHWAAEQGATFVDVAEWTCAQWFMKEGDRDSLETVKREVLGVRHRVGICDVSTRGKIEVQGPDAGALIDRMYINGFSNLSIGKACYGVMLRDDGFVMDDGTLTRFAEDHYFITTTTHNAARVMQHIDYCSQVLWPELNAQATSVTEHWATYAIAGPKSRALLQAFFPSIDLSNAGLPHMGAFVGQWTDTPVRLSRLSFSGELGYEISVPARHGDAFVRALFEAGRAFEIVPYGTEALSVLRVEKGHLGSSEINGQTTAADLGLERMMSRTKDFIGRVMAGRPGLVDPSRPALVGLRSLHPDRPLRAGAHLLPVGASATAENDEGYVTSAAWSPTLGHAIALALLRHGRDRHGERIMVHDPLRGDPVAAQVCSPVFVDPEGIRTRG